MCGWITCSVIPTQPSIFTHYSKIQNFYKTLLLDIFEFLRQNWKVKKNKKYQITEFSCQKSRFWHKIELLKALKKVECLYFFFVFFFSKSSVKLGPKIRITYISRYYASSSESWIFWTKNRGMEQCVSKAHTLPRHATRCTFWSLYWIERKAFE